MGRGREPPGGARLELTHLRYFLAVASCGSLTAAARQLGVSQPTLTVAMRTLEEKLGTTLLQRERTGVRLTVTGDELVRHAQEVFALLERAEQQIRGLEEEPSGRLVVGCHESLGAYFLPGFLASFLREAPRVDVSLWNGPSAAVQQAVLDRHVHFGLVVNPVPQPDLVLLDLFHDEVTLFVAAAPGQDPPPAGPDDGPDDEARGRLEAGPLIFAGRVPQCRTLIEELARQNLLPHRLLPCGDFELVKSLSLAELGVGMMPARVAAYHTDGRLRRLRGVPRVPDTIRLVFRADIHRTRAVTMLKDALLAYGRSLDRAT